MVEISFKIDEDGEEKDKEIKRPKNIFKISFFILGLIMFFTSLFSFLNKREVLKQLLIGGEEASKIAADTSVVWTYVLLLLLMVTGLSSIIWSLKRGKISDPMENQQVEKGKRFLSKRTILSGIIILILRPGFNHNSFNHL